MLTTSDHALPCAATPEEGYQNLAFAIVAQTVKDLRDGPPQRRQQARYCVQRGGLCWWMDLMGLSAGARARVAALLDELCR